MSIGQGYRHFLLDHFRRSHPIPAVLYGANQVGYGSTGTPNRDTTAITQLQQMGCTCLRIAWQWSALQPSSSLSSIFWSGPDAVVAAAAGTGIALTFCIYSSPSWANGGLGVNGIPTSGSGTDTSWQAAYAAYLGAFAGRYAGKGIVWEIWDEPNANYSGSFWQPNGSTTTAPSATQYLSLYNTARTAIKAADANAIVSTGGVTALTYWSGSSTVTGITWLQSLMTAGVVAEAFGAHPYTSPGGVYNPATDSYPTGNSYKDIGRLQTAMVSGGYGTTPIHIGEFGDYSAATAGGESTKATYVTAALNLVKGTYGAPIVGGSGAGVARVHYFSLNNATNGTSDTTDTGLYTGTPLTGPNTQLGSGAALQTFMTGVPAGVLQTITLAGPSSLVMTQSGTYTAVGTTVSGTVISYTPTYASSNTGVATIAGTGVVTLVSAGTTTISVSAVNSNGQTITGTPITLTVSAQVATSSVVSPNPWAGTAGGSTVTFSVVVKDQVGNTISSPAGAWSSSDATDAPINSATGVLTPTNAATNVVVTFTPTGVSSAAGSSTGNVVSSGTPVLTTIVLSGATSVITTHSTAAYTAPGKDQSSNPFTYTPFYQSSNTAIATINSGTGVATGVTAGTSSITATNIATTPTRIQHPTSQTVGSVTLTQSTGAGNTLIVRALMSKGATITAITDNATGGSNPYTQCPGVYTNATDGLGGALDIWYAKNTKAGATTITITYGGSPAGAITYVDEWADLDPTNPFDTASSFWSQTAGTIIGSASAQVTIATAKEVLFAIGGCPSVANTVSGIHSGNVFTLGDTLFGSATAQYITTATGSYFPQWDQPTSGEWFASVAAFKVAPQPPAVTSNAITLTVSAQVPTGTIAVAPSSATIAVSGTQLLVPTVSDQGSPANTIPSATVSWATSDATKATVNSGGLVTGVAVGSATITATDGSASGTSAITISGSAVSFDPTNTSTGQGILLTNGAQPIWSDWPRRYANDTAFRTACATTIGVWSNSAKAGTGTAGPWTPSTQTGNRYGDGRYIDLCSWVATPDATYGPTFSEPCFEGSIIAPGSATSSPACEMRPAFASGQFLSSWVGIIRRAYCATPVFTAVGDATGSGQLGGNASFKSGMFGSYVGQGRAGQETGNWGGSPPAGQIFLETNSSGPATGGFSETAYGVGTDATWQNGTPFWESLVMEQFTRSSDGTFWTAMTRFKRLDGDTHWTQDSPRILGQISALTQFSEFDINSVENYNQTRATTLKYWFMQGALFNFDNPNNDGSNDPAGYFAYIAGLTPATPVSISVTSHSSSSVTCTVAVSRYMAAVRLQIDGTTINGQDYTLQRTDAEGVVVTGVAQQGTISMTVTGLSLASGSHTVRAFAVNKNGTALDSTGIATTFTQ